MSWIDDTIWWHVYPLGFVGAPIHPEQRSQSNWRAPDLKHLSRWLDYLIDLGCNGLLLGPIFESSSHGYDSLDLFRIDSRLGTQEGFDTLVAACKDRGIRILLDGVFSHVGNKHPLLIKALESGPDSAEAALFDIEWEQPEGPAPKVWEGHGSLARFDHRSPETRDYVESVLTYWLDRGIDGWRLDAAYSVPAAFWAEVLPRVRERYPEAWFLGEVIHGDYSKFVTESTVNSVTQYELWKATWSSLKDRNLFELDWTLKRNNELFKTFVPNTFIGNHDVTRIATTLGAQLSVAAFAIQMTVGGVPSIYYGDEQAFTGEKIEDFHGDDAIRPPMPVSPDQLLPFGADQMRAFKELIALRRNHPWLVRALTEVRSLENARMTYESFADANDQRIRVRLDLESQPTVIIEDHLGQIIWTN